MEKELAGCTSLFSFLEKKSLNKASEPTFKSSLFQIQN
jgi:hypothetical protein